MFGILFVLIIVVSVCRGYGENQSATMN